MNNNYFKWQILKRRYEDCLARGNTYLVEKKTLREYEDNLLFLFSLNRVICMYCKGIMQKETNDYSVYNEEGGFGSHYSCEAENALRNSPPPINSTPSTGPKEMF